MNKFFKWIKEHVRPHFRYNKRRDKKPDDDLKLDSLDSVEDNLKKNSEIGIKFRFKF